MSTEKFTFNGTALIRKLKSTLERLDPGYAGEYQLYTQAKLRLSDSAFTEALDSRLAAKLLYVAWQGTCWNLECSRNPENKLRIQADYEELHGESRLAVLPGVCLAERAICTAIRQFSPEQQALAMQVQDFYAYLETVGFKLAHLWGFQWGNVFFPEVIPGYVPDIHFTFKYRHMVEQDLDMILADPA